MARPVPVSYAATTVKNTVPALTTAETALPGVTVKGNAIQNVSTIIYITQNIIIP